MGHSANVFKKKLESGERILGMFVMSGSPNVVECLGWAGLDVLMIDLEHSPTAIGDLVSCARALAGTPTLLAARLPSDDPVVIKQVLDVGVQTIMVPMVQSAEQAKRIVTATRYPPEGIRGFALMHRASRFTAEKDYANHANEDICVLAQLETPAAIDNLEAIGSIGGIDAVFVGPGDLSAAMGFLGNPGHCDVETVLADVARRSVKEGIRCGTMTGNTEGAKRHFSSGFQFIIAGTDLAVLLSATKEMISEIAPSSSA